MDNSNFSIRSEEQVAAGRQGWVSGVHLPSEDQRNNIVKTYFLRAQAPRKNESSILLRKPRILGSFSFRLGVLRGEKGAFSLSQWLLAKTF
eukprot:596030-Pelagomonas_calceolata.AAC.5